MRLQVSNPAESFPAGAAAVGFLPRVDPLVFPQVPRLGEGLPAGGAAEGLLPGVDALVDLHLLGPVEGLPAVAAHKESLLGAGWMARWVLGEAETESATSPAVHAGGWETARDHGIRTRGSPSCRDGPGPLVKLPSERVFRSVVDQHGKIGASASASVSSELLRVCGLLLGATRAALRMRGGVTDLHSSAAAATLPPPALSPGQALGLLVLRSQEGSRSSKGDGVHHTFMQTEKD